MTEKDFKSYHNDLFAYVKKHVQNEADAQDIVQDVFYKLSKSDLSTIDNFKRWIYRVTKNTIIDYYRKKRLTLTALEDRFMAEQQDENEVVHELSGCIIPMIEQLPEDYQKLIRLSEIDGYSQKQIADELNMNYVTVRSKIQRGRTKLKALFSSCCSVKQAGKGSIVDFHNKTNCC